MYLDALKLREFYYRTRLGRAVQSHLQSAIGEMWAKRSGQVVLGFGFANPVLRPFFDPTSAVTALMPGPQGGFHWPTGEPNRAVLCSETQWPVEAQSVDRLIFMHAMESSNRTEALLGEAWRVLAPEGRLLVIIPNRAGVWARTDRTPFGHGRPFSVAQIEKLMADAGFARESEKSALFFPPSHGRFWQKAAPLIEKSGRAFGPRSVGGALLIEASKHILRPRGTPVAEHRYLPGDNKVGLPVPAPTRYEGKDVARSRTRPR
ncbi:class I SAM-dependent methyltransferase [Paracoccaceae bacterium GXU_MW_L88]